MQTTPSEDFVRPQRRAERVREIMKSLGFRHTSIQLANTGSAYVKGCLGKELVQVRIADHCGRVDIPTIPVDANDEQIVGAILPQLRARQIAEPKLIVGKKRIGGRSGHQALADILARYGCNLNRWEPSIPVREALAILSGWLAENPGDPRAEGVEEVIRLNKLPEKTSFGGENFEAVCEIARNMGWA